MDEDDYRALIAALESELRDIGAADIADEDHYTIPDGDTGEERLLEPKERLIQMLLAFDRFLAVRDGNTYRDAMHRIAEFTTGTPPRGAAFLPVADGSLRRAGDFSDLPDLSSVRSSLHSLIQELRFDSGPSEGAP